MEWTVKYAPKSLNDLVGNKKNYAKLITWLNNYYKVKKSARAKDFKLIALLLGSPGVGKTSGINAIAKELNYEIIEFNASDQRNERVITHLVGRETKTVINQSYNGKIVLLDEVDGIQGREDKGGLSALMRVARESAHPIICTANDPQNSKIRSLKNSPMTLKLDFDKPTTAEMTVLLENIAKREGIAVPPKLLQVICTNAHGDIRGALNDLENLAQERKEIPMNAIQALSIRDSEVTINRALNQIFGEAKTPRQAHEVTSDLDVDYSMFMHYVIDSIPAHSSYPAEREAMYSNAALSDLFLGRIMSTQHWKYLKYYFYFLSAGVWASKQSPYKPHYPRFPSSISALSGTKKVRAIRKSVTLKFGKLTHSSRNKVIAYNLPFIRLYFERLYELYLEKKIDTPKGQQVLEVVASIHNECSLEEDEFIYLFNDPLYEKQSAAEEKKQKLLMKIIEAKAIEIRQDKIVTHNRELNQLLAFKGPAKKTKKKESVKEELTSTIADSPVKEKEEELFNKIDTFDQEEEIRPKTTKKKAVKKVKTDSKETKKSEKKKSAKKDKEKQKTLMDFNSDQKESKDKKKKGSKNLLEFM